jgi:hypothetical protein
LRFHSPSGSYQITLGFRPAYTWDFRWGSKIQELRAWNLRLEKHWSVDLDLVLEPRWETQKRRQRLPNYGGALFNLSSAKVEGELGYNLNQAWRTFVVSEWESTLDNQDSSTAKLLSLEPGVSRAFLMRGRLTAKYRWITVSRNTDRMYYEAAQGLSAGIHHQWSLSADFKFNDYLFGNLNYYGKDDPVLDRVIHQGTMEMKALF